MKLSKTEEKLMDLMWKNETVFLNLIDSYPEPKGDFSTGTSILADCD